MLCPLGITFYNYSYYKRLAIQPTPTQNLSSRILKYISHCRINLTSEEPMWTVRGLEWDVRFRLVAVAYNSKGRSAQARIDDVLFRDPEKRTGKFIWYSLGKS